MVRANATPKRKTRTRSKQQPVYIGEHLVVHPGVCFGRMTFNGTRIPVEMILDYLARGYTREYLRKSWPEVSDEAIEEAVRLAADTFLEHYGSKRS